MVRQLVVIVIVNLGVIRAMVIGELRVPRGELWCLWWTELLWRWRRWCKEVDMVMKTKVVTVRRRGRGGKRKSRRRRIGVLCVMEIGRSRIHSGGSYSLIFDVSVWPRLDHVMKEKNERVISLCYALSRLFTRVVDYFLFSICTFEEKIRNCMWF